MNKNILITGAGGMVGKNLLDSLIDLEGYKVFPSYYDITIPKKDSESVNKIINAVDKLVGKINIKIKKTGVHKGNNDFLKFIFFSFTLSR